MSASSLDMQNAFGQLYEGLVEDIARRVLAELENRQRPETETQPDGWLDTAGAAAYLGISKNALHKLTAERSVPFEQDGPGCKCWFKRSELDEWRRNSASHSVRRRAAELNEWRRR